MAEKKENLWSQILQQTQNEQRFTGKNVVILGDKHSGKRTFLDQLHDISETVFPKLDKNDTNPGKLKITGSSSALDYVYLNVKNLDDKDDETMTRIGISLIDQVNQQQLLGQVLNQQSIKNTLFVIFLNYKKPWNLLDTLNQWIDVINSSLENLQVPLKQFEQMRANVKKIVQTYKEPKTKEEKAELSQNITEEQPEQDLPLGEGVLENNLGVPIMIVCNNCEQKDISEKDQDFILYNLRKYSIRYGATLLYTSIKQQQNLDIFYEYILSVLYSFEFKHKSDPLNHEKVFIPSGYDNLTLLNQSFPDINKEAHYSEIIKDQTQKQTNAQEEVVQEDEDFFQQLRKDRSTGGGSQRQSQIGVRNIRTSIKDNQKNKDDLNNFYQDLLSQKKNQQGKTSAPADLKSKAEQDLKQKMGTTLPKKDNQIQNQIIQDIINKSKVNDKKN